MDDYLAGELAVGRIAKVDHLHALGIVCSRFGVIPKRGQLNQWQLNLDLLYLPGQSVNDGIEPGLSPLHYVSVDHMVQRILQLGQGALLAEVDIKRAPQCPHLSRE